MTDNFTSKLLEISVQIGQTRLPLSADVSEKMGKLKEGYERILEVKNGFVAFENALHFFHSGYNEDYIDINDWNQQSLWIDQYSHKAKRYVFFAQDIFGSQFVIFNDAIYTFDPETENIDYMSNCFDSWSNKILEDYEFLTGHPIAREWQNKNGPIKKNCRLIPKIPFVCGGKYETDNLFELEMTKSMRSRANFSNQIRDLPDGAKIEFGFSSN